VERASLPVLRRLTRMPRLVPALAIAACAVGGLALDPPVGSALLLVVAAVVAWLSYLSWPLTTASARALRLLLLGLILVAAVLPNL
jgi:hypothetical protein